MRLQRIITHKSLHFTLTNTVTVAVAVAVSLVSRMTVAKVAVVGAQTWTNNSKALQKARKCDAIAAATALAYKRKVAALNEVANLKLKEFVFEAKVKPTQAALPWCGEKADRLRRVALAEVCAAETKAAELALAKANEKLAATAAKEQLAIAAAAALAAAADASAAAAITAAAAFAAAAEAEQQAAATAAASAAIAAVVALAAAAAEQAAAEQLAKVGQLATLTAERLVAFHSAANELIAASSTDEHIAMPESFNWASIVASLDTLVTFRDQIQAQRRNAIHVDFQ